MPSKINRPLARRRAIVALAVGLVALVSLDRAVRGDALLGGPPPAGPRLTIEPARIDFGARGHGETARAELVLTNAGDGPLTVRSIAPTCSCITISPPALEPIPPGASRRVTVTMTSGRAMGSLVKHLRIETDDAAAPRRDVAIGMSVLEGFDAEPRDLRFVGIVGGAPVETSFVVRRGPRRAGAAAAAPGAPDFKLEVDRFDVRYGISKAEHFRARVEAIDAASYKVTIAVDGSHPEGRIQADFHARIDGKTFIAPIAGEMFAHILVAPTFLAFSDARAGDPERGVREFRLSSTDERGFAILGVEQQPAPPRAADREAPPVELGFEVGSAPSQRAHTVRVILKPPPEGATPSGSFFGKVRVRTDHPDKPSIEVTYSGFFSRPRTP